MSAHRVAVRIVALGSDDPKHALRTSSTSIFLLRQHAARKLSSLTNICREKAPAKRGLPRS